MKMEINSSKDFIKCRDIILKNMKSESLKYKRTNDVKHLDNVQKLQNALNKLEDLISYYSTYDTKDFALFMKNFLTLTEGDFVSTKIVVEDERYDKSEPKKKNTYYMVSDKASSEFVKGHVRNEIELTYFLDFHANEDVTFFDKKFVFPFNRKLRIKSEFSKYPRLEEAIYELIDLKLDNPAISDIKRFHVVLENALRNNLNNSNERKKS